MSAAPVCNLIFLAFIAEIRILIHSNLLRFGALPEESTPQRESSLRLPPSFSLAPTASELAFSWSRILSFQKLW